MFARSTAKSQSQNEQGSGSNAPAPPSATPDNATAEELKNLLDCQRLEMEGLRARLEALARGGQQFTYRGVKFVTQEGVLKWIASNGNHIPVSAKPSGDCRRGRDLRKPEGERQHWHFQCPYWS